MGLDVYSILMDLEKRFDVEFGEDEFAEVRTVQQLTEVVFAKKKKAEESHERLDAAFEFVQGVVEGVEQREMLDLTLQTPILSALSRKGLVEFWRIYRYDLGVRLPALQHSQPRVYLAAFALIGVAIPGLLLDIWEWTKVPGGIILGAGAAGWCFLRIEPWTYTVPPQTQTLEDLVQYTALRVSDLQQPALNWDEVRLGVVAVLSENLQIPPSMIQDDSRLVEDLGMQ